MSSFLTAEPGASGSGKGGSMSDVLEVKIRESRGTRAAQRERREGLVPAILFGHKEGSLALSIPQTQVSAVIRHGSRIVDLKGAVQESAMISDVQWDPFGSTVLHLDLTRVSADERITLYVTVDLKGEAPGVAAGGSLNVISHELEIECAANNLPERLIANLNTLMLDESLTAGEIELPPGVTLISPADTVVVQCNEQVEVDEEAGMAIPGEPEIIGLRRGRRGVGRLIVGTWWNRWAGAWSGWRLPAPGQRKSPTEAVMKLVVGLGNPGPKYAGTRHNVGFDVIAQLAKKHGDGRTRSKFTAELMEARIGGEKIVLMSPLTYMNESGRSVQPARDFYKLALEDVLVVCDDLSLPVAKLRFRPGGSAGGQKGLADILRRLGSQEVPRLRIGIGQTPPGWDAAAYVLGKFAAEERAEVELAIQRAATAVADWVDHDTAFCMNRYNGG